MQHICFKGYHFVTTHFISCGAIMVQLKTTNMIKATANLFLDTRKESANKKYPVKLTIYHRPNKKRYGTGISLTKDEWLKLSSSRLKDEDLKDIKIKLAACVNKANDVFKELTTFSFTAFEKHYFNATHAVNDMSLQKWFKDYKTSLDNEERVGTSISYNTTLNSLDSFKKNLMLTDITKEFLMDYEKQMLQAGKSLTTIGIYLRNLRAIVNTAIRKGAMNRDDYPFNGYQIPGSRNIKKALNDNELEALLNYTPKRTDLQLGYDFWILSYLCNGMNVTDILHLTDKNLDGNFLSFTRQKTKRTKKKDLRPIKMVLHPRAIEIINRWKHKNKDAEYLFPFLEGAQSAKTIKYRTQKFIKKVNDSMEEIRVELKIDKKLGTYVARHSFSTRLMRKGASTHYIKESLGHSSVITTENYLGDFSDSVKSEFSELLTKFS